MSESRNDPDVPQAAPPDEASLEPDAPSVHEPEPLPQVGVPIDVVAAVRAAAVPKHKQRAWGWWALAAVGVFVSIVLAAGIVQVVAGTARPGQPVATSPRPLAGPERRPPASPSPDRGASAPTKLASGPSVRASLTEAQWQTVVAAIDDARAAAFARADVSMLAAFDRPGSAAYGQDAAAVQALKSHAVRADGFVLDVAAVRVRTATADAAQLLVTDSRPAFAWRSLNNAVMARVPARPRASWLVQVRRGGTLGWQVVSVRAITPATQRPASQQSSGR